MNSNTVRHKLCNIFLLKWGFFCLLRCDNKTKVGQNLAFTSWSSGFPDYSITEFVTWWNDEKEDYTYNDGSCTGVCGHYTQVSLLSLVIRAPGSICKSVGFKLYCELCIEINF